MIPENDRELRDLARRYPRWRIWRGHVTGDVWALPPPGHPQRSLVSAADPEALEKKVAELTSWESNEQP